ncbi:hypothetical protein MLD38_029691 [Melastoma candidum]|uniref:Uncharacterized protein n=1 Tax=Melastoma candidum TaxID=119954 RepID=A0ACB9N5C5_9MYRT|nr:hypothetical protein MLD38_029691 [Melastoma candidum]
MIAGKLGAVGGRTARACDGCLKTRARWYCSADDAFLCQECDMSVHSANQLARRHERIRLQTSSASFKPSPDVNDGELGSPRQDDYGSMPVWSKGITRKARTPRGKSNPRGSNKSHVFSAGVVPRVGNDDENEDFDEGDDDQLMCRVPVFDPFDNPVILYQNEFNDPVVDDFNLVLPRGLDDLSPDVDLADFVAKVESLLETSGEKDSGCANKSCLVVDDVEQALDCENEDCGDVKIELRDSLINVKEEEEEKKKMKMLLRLDYEAVLNECAVRGCNCAWSNGIPPQDFDFHDDGWPNLMGNERTLSDILHCRSNVKITRVGGFPRGDTEGREARVLRYKEKRRMRMFSKKIRYEVRKLNAEKRPRMKGRFVKRSPSPLSFVQGLPPPYFQP